METMKSNPFQLGENGFESGGSNPAGVLQSGGIALGGGGIQILEWPMFLMSWRWIFAVFFVLSLSLSLSPSLCCLCAEGEWRTGSVALTVQQPRRHLSVCLPGPQRVRPFWAELWQRGVIRSWWDGVQDLGTGEAHIQPASLVRARLCQGPGGWGCWLSMDSSERQWRGSKGGQWDLSGPFRKVSDQGSRFGLVTSVPLHICQLWTQGAAEKTAVTGRPAEEHTKKSVFREHRVNQIHDITYLPT